MWTSPSVSPRLTRLESIEGPGTPLLQPAFNRFVLVLEACIPCARSGITAIAVFDTIVLALREQVPGDDLEQGTLDCGGVGGSFTEPIYEPNFHFCDDYARTARSIRGNWQMYINCHCHELAARAARARLLWLVVSMPARILQGNCYKYNDSIVSETFRKLTQQSNESLGLGQLLLYSEFQVDQKSGFWS